MDSTRSTTPVDHHYYEVAKPNSLAERILSHARDRIYDDFVRIAAPRAHETILDVGISDVIGVAANVLERRYPHSEMITAAGLGAAKEFQAAFPTVAYHQILPNKKLPFESGQFDIVTSNAVLEHVGSFLNQREFMAELCRVGRRVYVTVPYRYFPIEHHTGIPLVHWTETGFRLACQILGKSKWSDKSNLIMMTKGRLVSTLEPNYIMKIGYTGLALGPLSSNIYCYIENTHL